MNSFDGIRVLPVMAREVSTIIPKNSEDHPKINKKLNFFGTFNSKLQMCLNMGSGNEILFGEGRNQAWSITLDPRVAQRVRTYFW